MKKNLFITGMLTMSFLVLTSCKDEKQQAAEKSVNNYVTYVDSVSSVPEVDAKSNWGAIDASYQVRATEAETNLAAAKENEALREKLANSKAKYEALKVKYQAALEAEAKAKNPNQILRDRFFGEGKIGEDMDFSWVNKDNILKVYEDFFQAYKDNKKDFSREDYDEVKLLYEALDSRKNTVEKQGLTSEDNSKIAAIKFKFAPMFKINRIGAKARETKEAKDVK